MSVMNNDPALNSDENFQEEISLLEILNILAKRSKFIIRFTATCAAISIVATLLMSKIYVANSKILPPQKDASGASALLGQLGGLASSLGGSLSGLGGGGTADLYIGILKSRSVADAVITRLELHKEFDIDNRDKLRKKLEKLVLFKAGKDNIITVTAESKDPNKAAILANTFVDELQKKSLQLNLTKANLERTFLEKRLAVAKQDLKNSEESMKSFQEANKTIKADTQAAVAIESIAKIKAEIVSNEVKLAAQRNSMTDEAPEVQSRLASISRLKGQLAAMSGSSDSNGVIPSVGKAPGLGVEYMRRLREFKIQEALFEQLTKQYELAKLNEARDSSSIQVLDEAIAPTKKSKPMRGLIVAVATITALFTAFVIAFIQEYLSKLSTEDNALLAEIKSNLSLKSFRRSKA